MDHRRWRSGSRLAALLATLLTAVGATGAWAQGAEGEVTLGMSAPFTGVAKELGLQLRNGLEVAFAVANEAGGVHGRRLRLLPYDDRADPARTLIAMNELKKKTVLAVIGSVGTSTAEIAVPFANEKQLLFFGALSGAGVLRNDPPDRYVFNFRPSCAEETAAIIRYLVDVRRIDVANIAVFSQDDSFGEGGFEGVAKALRHYRSDAGRILRVSYKRNTADVDEAVKAIKRAGGRVKAVVLLATYKPAARFIEKLRDAGADLIFANVSLVGPNELAEELSQLGPSYADGVIVTQVVPNPNAQASAIIKYREQLKRFAPGENPGFLSLEGWLVGRLFIEGLDRAGLAPTTDTVIDALESIRGLDLGIGVPLTFGPSEHQASHKIWGTVMDGKGAFSAIDLE